MVVTLDVRVNGIRSEVLSARWRTLSITLTDDDTEDAATLTLSAGASLDLPPRSAELAFVVDGVEMGGFEVHRVRGSTRAGTVSIEAASISPESALREQKSRGWEGQKVGEVVAVIADGAGLAPSIDPAVGGRSVTASIQVGESDLAFARRVVADAGGRLIVQDGRMIVAGGDRARANLPALEVDLRAEGTWVDWSRGWRRTLGRVRASYLLEDGSTAAEVEVGTGEEARSRTLRTVYPSRDVAISAASAYLASGATSRDNVDLVTGLMPMANVLQPLRIIGGEERLPGGLPALIVRRVQHAIGRQAATTSLTASAEATGQTFIVSPPPDAITTGGSSSAPVSPGDVVGAPGGGSGGGGSLPIGGELDPATATWLHTDVSGWPVTSTITDVTIRDVPAGGICLAHTKAGSWPAAVTAGGPNIAGNAWIFANLGGKWYGAAYEWLRPGQICKLQARGQHGAPSRELGPHTKRSPLTRWTPRAGEQVGFMVSTPARAGAQGPVRERSNIVVVTWP